MKTIIKILNELNRTEVINEAAAVIRQGGIVAFPTETVYGLGANALDPEAVKKIFIAKGRPQDNPLIIHVASKDLSPYVETVPTVAEKLMDAFWPGPLTLILKKKALIPDVTSAGLATVGVRMPKHDVALALISAAGVPIAAPSANRSGRPSPTSVEHCINDLDGRVDFILGADRSEVGLESTIVDCTVTPPCILRPGGIALEQLQAIEPTIYFPGSTKAVEGTPKAPGMKYRHYAPIAPLKIVHGVQELQDELLKHQKQGLKVGVLATEESLPLYQNEIVISLGHRNHLEEVGHKLYDALRLMDELGVEIILVEEFPEIGIGKAIMNRLKKAQQKDSQ